MKQGSQQRKSPTRWGWRDQWIQCVSWSGLFMLLLVACAEQSPPEEAIRAFVQQAVQAGEARDVSALSDLIDEDYQDAQQRGARDLLGMAMGYFLRNRNIHLWYQIEDITLQSADRAQVSLYMATAGEPITGTDSLLSLRADLVRFELGLVRRGGDWQLQTAQWRRATLEDFLGPPLAK